jgi:hypothetical protein
MEKMVSDGRIAKSGVIQELVDRIELVVFFAAHPQQRNIRDKATGKIIACYPTLGYSSQIFNRVGFEKEC